MRAIRSQEAARAQRLIEADGAQRLVTVNLAESPLSWLASRKDKAGRPMIAPHQFEAGERLRADFERGGLTQRVTASWTGFAGSRREKRGAPSCPAEFSDFTLAARERFRRAIDAVGPELSGVLLDVCCELKGLEDAERAEGWPKRSGKVILQMALERLARHYGLVGESGASRSLGRRLRHWGTSDYRPDLG